MVINIHYYQFFMLFGIIQLLVSLRHVCCEVENGSNVTRCFEWERQALLKFKEEIFYDFGRLSSWGIEENKRDCCKWKGVYCDNRNNHVTRLDLRAPLQEGYLSTAPLQGKISPSLLELQHLNYLDLSFNGFYYFPFPEFIGSLRKLQYLNLSNANLYGPIPQSLGNLSRLQYLDLNDIFLYDENEGQNIDWVSRLHSLKYLDLSYVNLSTSTNWLQTISGFPSIKVLYLTGCYLPYILPSSLPSINASSPLTILDLSMNNVHLSSSFIQWWSNFSSNLNRIDLSQNILMHPIPDAFDNMLSLAHLDLSYIKIKGSGGIPQYFGNMSSLEYLNLAGNGLSGILSELIVNLLGPLENKLHHLDLSNNNVSGLLPDFSRFSFLRELKLGGNNLNGIVYEGNLQLPNLVLLNLGENQLTGPIPDLSFSSSLKELYLYKNMFNGTLTESIGCLSNLEILSLCSNKLEGVITEIHLFNLSRLQLLDISLNSLIAVNFSHFWVPPFQIKYLSLGQCKIGPQFPKWLRTQKEIIHLDISETKITDIVPGWFVEVAHNFTHLNLSNNKIHGVFPNISISDRMFDVLFFHLTPYMFSTSTRVTLDLSRNRISGSVTFLCNSVSWNFVDLSNNLFSDQLPDCYSKFERLEYLNLANNNLSGKIPHSFGDLRVLTWLRLRNNSISGEIPTSMSNCTALHVIDLGKNRLTGNIPAWIGHNNSYLVVLSLRSNGFSGSIPLSLCGLANLQVLDLSSNKISGAIPKCLKNLRAMTVLITFSFLRWGNARMPLSTLIYKTRIGYLVASRLLNKSPESIYLTWKGNEVDYTNSKGIQPRLLDLSNNTLSGEIPDEITELVSLHGLNFSRNNLSGSIPQNVGHLKYLDSLDLSRNHLSGSIPTSLFELSFKLDLSYNNLSGRIPPNSHFDESAYLGNSGLCGRPILNKFCPQDDETSRVPDIISGRGNASNNLGHEDDEFVTKGFYICIGFGFIVGFWGIMGTILLNKAFRYAFFKMASDVADYIYVKIVLNKASLQRHFTNK